MDFIYDQLPTTEHQIRLLYVKMNAQDSDDVNCTLRTYAFDRRPKHLALSYTWAPEQPTRTIQVNDKSFTVRENLFQFLKRYQADSAGDVPIWVDQICIDQNDDAEKSAQVLRMGELYASAKLVVIWLGVGTDKDTATVRLIRKVRANTKAGHTYEMNDDDLSNLRALLENPYWLRLWIVQEIALAKDLYIWIGLHSLDWDDFFEVYEKQQDRLSGGHANMIEDIHALHRLHVQRIDPRAFKTFHSLEDQIHYFCRHKCFNPRDRIFGILGLFPTFAPGLPPIDYAKSVERVYLDFCEVMIYESPEPDHTYGILDDLGDQMGLEGALDDWMKEDVRKEEIEWIMNGRPENLEMVKARLKREWLAMNPR